MLWVYMMNSIGERTVSCGIPVLGIVDLHLCWVSVYDMGIICMYTMYIPYQADSDR